jgi:hypothetical protein
VEWYEGQIREAARNCQTSVDLLRGARSLGTGTRVESLGLR